MKSFKFTESYHYTFIGVHAKKTVMVSVLQSHFCKSFYISDSNGQEVADQPVTDRNGIMVLIKLYHNIVDIPVWSASV